MDSGQKQDGVKPKTSALDGVIMQPETARLAILSQAASRLLVSDTPEQLVQPLAEQVMTALDCQFFFNFIPYPVKNCLRLNAYAGIPVETANQIALLDYGVAVCGTVAQQGHRIVKECIQDMDEPLVALVKPFGVRAYACHPLLSPKGDILGTLSFGTSTRDHFREDELSFMQTLSNQIAAAFQRSQAERELRRLNAELEERVVKRTRELEAINAELKSYANIVAHDFRTPMVNLKGFSGELGQGVAELREALSDPTIHLPPDLRGRTDELLSKDLPECLSYIGVAVDRLDRMVAALLRLSELGGHGGYSREIDVRSLVQSVVTANLGNNHGKDVRVEIAPLPSVYADPMVLELTFGNLIDNAIKYLDPGRPGEIKIAASITASEFIFSVQDNGRGIADEDCEKIFDIFRRAGRQDVPGEGVGLAYVRAVLRQVSGRVWCESELGVGTKMTFALPRRIAGQHGQQEVAR